MSGQPKENVLFFIHLFPPGRRLWREKQTQSDAFQTGDFRSSILYTVDNPPHCPNPSHLLGKICLMPIRGAFKIKKWEKLVFWTNQGGGVWPNPNFLAKFPKTKFALQLSINVMKHTLHKWGGNISSIHNVIGPPGGPPKRENGKSWAKVGTIFKRGGGGGAPFPPFWPPKKVHFHDKLKCSE